MFIFLAGIDPAFYESTGTQEEKKKKRPFPAVFLHHPFFEWLTSNGVHLIGPTQNKIRTPNSPASHTHTHTRAPKPMGHRKPKQKGPKTVMENVRNASTAEATTPTTMGILTHRGRKTAGPTGRESGPLCASGEKFEPDAKIRKLNTTRTHTHTHARNGKCVHFLCLLGTQRGVLPF